MSVLHTRAAHSFQLRAACIIWHSPCWRQRLLPLLSFLCKIPTSQHFAQVTKVCVTSLVNNTYHAAIHLARAVGKGDPTFQEVQVDSRPSGERCPSAFPLSTPWGTQ